MKLTDQLISRLNNELGFTIPIGTKIHHINPTINQQSRGSFKWVFNSNYSNYGSSVGVRELLKRKKLSISYTRSGGLSVVARSLIEILGDD